MGSGIQADFIVCRSERALDRSAKERIALFSNLDVVLLQWCIEGVHIHRYTRFVQTRDSKAYYAGKKQVHRYEFNNRYADRLEKKGLVINARNRGAGFSSLDFSSGCAWVPIPNCPFHSTISTILPSSVLALMHIKRIKAG